MTGDSDQHPRRRLRDVDSVARAYRIKAFGWSLFALFPGLVLGSLPVALGGFALAWLGSLALAELVSRTSGGLYFASGNSTRSSRQYSLAESLIVRGRFDEAMNHLEAECAQHTDDPTPALMLARLLRDRCDRPLDAVKWFRTAIERSAGDDAGTIAASRELIEVYMRVLRTPRPAMPWLARLASQHAGTATGEWARRELADIKAELREEEGT